MRLRRAGRLLLIGAVLGASGSLAADRPQAVGPQPVELPGLNDCPPIPDDAVPVVYRILAVPPDDYDDGIPADPEPWQQLSHMQVIDNRTEYSTILGSVNRDDADIDWEHYRLIAFLEFRVYQYGELYSDNRLSGVYATSEALIVSETQTNYAPCQGIAQDPGSFWFGSNYYLLVVPRMPGNIVRIVCRVGDCPPDIP